MANYGFRLNVTLVYLKNIRHLVRQKKTLQNTVQKFTSMSKVLLLEEK